MHTSPSSNLFSAAMTPTSEQQQHDDRMRFSMPRSVLSPKKVASGDNADAMTEAMIIEKVLRLTMMSPIWSPRGTESGDAQENNNTMARHCSKRSLGPASTPPTTDLPTFPTLPPFSSFAANPEHFHHPSSSRKKQKSSTRRPARNSTMIPFLPESPEMDRPVLSHRPCFSPVLGTTAVNFDYVARLQAETNAMDNNNTDNHAGEARPSTPSLREVLNVFPLLDDDDDDERQERRNTLKMRPTLSKRAVDGLFLG